MDKNDQQDPEYNLGITLSGGSARGYAHIGVLKALSEHGIEPDIISGTSMGAVIGVLYAAGYTPSEIHKILTHKPVFRVLGFSWKREGALRMDKLKEVLKDNLREDNFSVLKKPFYLGVTNLNEGKKEYRNSGPLFDYIIASASAPIIFAPKVIDGINYADGGLLCNLPASAIREQCRFLLGVHVNYPGTVASIRGVTEMLERTVLLAINQNAKPEMDLCDHLIDPPEMQQYSLFDFKKAEELIEVGYKHTMEQIRTGELSAEDLKATDPVKR